VRIHSHWTGRDRPFAVSAGAARISTVAIFFEVLLAIASAAILWFALYTVYRLVTDES
jgi:hypothetical protein